MVGYVKWSTPCPHINATSMLKIHTVNILATKKATMPQALDTYSIINWSKTCFEVFDNKFIALLCYFMILSKGVTGYHWADLSFITGKNKPVYFVKNYCLLENNNNTFVFIKAQPKKWSLFT